MRIGIAVCLLTIFASCKSDDEAISNYFNEADRDTLLTNIITYIGPYAQGAKNESRFESRFRKEYAALLKNYHFEKYVISKDSTHYYSIDRPVGNGAVFRRMVGGKFRLKANSLLPLDFEELWCSPPFKKDSLNTKRHSDYVFREMVKKGNINHLLTMKHYIEWPDSTLIYDKQKHEWVRTNKANF